MLFTWCAFCWDQPGHDGVHTRRSGCLLTSRPPNQCTQVSKVCGCLTATYIGGSANLAEVAWDTALAKDGQGMLACLAAADVVLMCFYFASLMLVPWQERSGKGINRTPVFFGHWLIQCCWFMTGCWEEAIWSQGYPMLSFKGGA